MNGGQLPTNQLHNINWGALKHASLLYTWTLAIATMYIHGTGDTHTHTHAHTHRTRTVHEHTTMQLRS